jgi:hypothetical protein
VVMGGMLDLSFRAEPGGPESPNRGPTSQSATRDHQELVRRRDPASPRS